MPASLGRLRKSMNAKFGVTNSRLIITIDISKDGMVKVDGVPMSVREPGTAWSEAHMIVAQTVNEFQHSAKKYRARNA
jgi:hypothetical protein